MYVGQAQHNNTHAPIALALVNNTNLLLLLMIALEMGPSVAKGLDTR